MIDVDERGFDGHGRTLCRSHVEDGYLVELIDKERRHGKCCICGQESEDQLPLEGVLRRIMGVLNREGWEPCAEYNASHDIFSLLDAYFSDDVFTVGDAHSVLSVLRQEINAWDWCHRSEAGDQALGIPAVAGSWSPREGWDTFSKLVQHTSRFAFMRAGGGAAHLNPDGADVAAQFVDEFIALLRKYRGRLVTNLDADTVIFRAHLVEDFADAKKRWDRGEYTAARLGSAPQDLVGASRMSPAGISMFYGATDPETAVAEVAAHDTRHREFAVVGAFRTTRAIRVLDLRSANVKAPSIFHDSRQEERSEFQFLMGFVSDITRPIRLDGREHREYAPTQAITELIRWSTDPDVDGIWLPSAQREDGENLVLFYGHPRDGGPTQPYDVKPEDINVHQLKKVVTSRQVYRFVKPPMPSPPTLPPGI